MDTYTFSGDVLILSYSWFCSLGFQLLVIKCGLKTLNKILQNKQFITFKLHIVLSDMLMPCSVLPWIWIILWSCISTLHTLLALKSLSICLSYHIDHGGISVLVFKWLLCYIIIVPKSTDAGDSNMPKRSHKVLPLSEKMKVLDLIRKEKYMVSLLWYAVRNLPEIVKKEKEMYSSFAAVPQTLSYICIYGGGTYYIWDLVLLTLLGIHCGSWDASSRYEGETTVYVLSEFRKCVKNTYYKNTSRISHFFAAK